jgi:hypothetical protein
VFSHEFGHSRLPDANCWLSHAAPTLQLRVEIVDSHRARGGVVTIGRRIGPRLDYVTPRHVGATFEGSAKRVLIEY